MTLLTSPNGEFFPVFRLFTLNRFKPYNNCGFPSPKICLIISNRPRNRWGWGLHAHRLNNTGKFNSFNLRRILYKQILRNSNLGAFLKYWKGQKREMIATGFINYFMTKWTVIGAINEGNNFTGDRTQVGSRYSKRKRLVSEILGFRGWCWRFNPTTIH